MIYTIPGIIGLSGLRSKVLKPRYFFELHWQIKTILWDLYRGNVAGTLEASEFDCREKPLQDALLPISSYENSKAGKIFRNMFVDKPHTQIKLSTDTLVEEVQSIVLETNELQSLGEQHAYPRFEILSQSNLRWEQKTWCFSFQKNSKFKTYRLTSWKNPAGSSGKKVLIRRNITHTHDYWQFMSAKFPKKGWKKKIRKINQLVQKQNCWFRHWRKNSWQLLWGIPSLNSKTNQNDVHFLPSLAHQDCVATN